MPTFRITLEQTHTVTLSLEKDVEADTEDEAREIAEDALEAGTWDDDWSSDTLEFVEFDGEEIIDIEEIA